MQRIRSISTKTRRDPARAEPQPELYLFKVTPDGPLGSLNVKLTAGRSIALDADLPAAALTFVETKKPLSDGLGQSSPGWTAAGSCSTRTPRRHNGTGRADLFGAAALTLKSPQATQAPGQTVFPRAPAEASP